MTSTVMVDLKTSKGEFLTRLMFHPIILVPATPTLLHTIPLANIYILNTELLGQVAEVARATSSILLRSSTVFDLEHT